MSCGGGGATITTQNEPATATQTSGKPEDGDPWIVEAKQTPRGAPPKVGDDPAPTEVSASPETKAWAESLVSPLGSGWKAGSVYEVDEGGERNIQAATLQGPNAILSVSAQTLQKPMAILPPLDTPGLNELGTYDRRADGSELLVVDLQTYAGMGPDDYRIFYVQPDGTMFSFNYAERSGPKESPEQPTALTLEQLKAFALSSGGGLK